MLRIIRERLLPKIGLWSIVGFIMVCAAIAVAIFALNRSRGYVASLSEFSVKNIIIAKPPAWAPQALLVAKIREVFPKNANMFDRDLPKKVYKACKNLYWVEQIHSVRKVYPDTLRLKMKLRTPAAYVRYSGEPYLTDQKGRRLPNHYYRKPDSVPDMLYIKGIRGVPPEPGEKWGDHEALMAAIDVVEDIAGTALCRKARITTVDASNFGGRRDITYSHIVLWTEHQTRILWGRSGRTPEFGDLSTKEKLANLEKALEEYRGLSKVEYVNVYSVAGQCPGKYRNGGGAR